MGDWRAVRRWFAARRILSKIYKPRDIDRLDGYRKALEDHFCITVTDCSGRLVEVNKRFCEVIGYSESELLGQPYRDVELRPARAGIARGDVAHRARRPDLARRVLRSLQEAAPMSGLNSIVIPRFNREGAIEQFITISTDITPIRQQAQTLQAMIDNFPGGIALVNRDGRLVSNRLYRTLLDLPEALFADGHPKLETLVRFRAERGDYGTALAVEEAIAHRLKTLLSPVPIVQERNENTGKVLEISCIPIPGDRHLNIYVDITERRRAELELKRAHSTLTAFIKHAPAAVAMFDTQMRYVAHSDRWLHDYKLTEESLVGRHHYDVFPEIPPHWRAKHLRILAGATESSPEEVFKRADGSTNIIRWEVRPWHLDDGTIGGIMMLTEEITERKKLEHQLWRLAKLDSLTGLPNRLQFNENLQALLASAGAAGQQFAVGLIDVDRFKETNDILGHAAGDELLKEIATRLEAALKPDASIARLGGDEFAVLISMEDGTAKLDQAIASMFSALSHSVVVGGVQHRCTISLGLTIFPTDATGASELLKNADLALYRAKELGRDRHQFFFRRHAGIAGADLQAAPRYPTRAADERAVPAVPADRLGIQAASRRLRGAAALEPSAARALLARRLRGGVRRSQSGGRGRPLGHRPRAAAGRRVGAKWARFRPRRRQRHLGRFCVGHVRELVRDKLQQTGVSPERLCIEVTERVFLGRGAGSVAVALEKLHDLGVEIALDDFGTGFGSLSHLKKLPIDRLKVDRSFVSDMETNPDNMAIVRTITQLAQSLRIETTIEGVETPTQLMLLRAMGCDTMQGFLFSKPLQALQVPGYLNRGRRARSA